MNCLGLAILTRFFFLLLSLSTITPCAASMGTAAALPGPSVTPTIFGPPGLDKYWMKQLNAAFKDAITIARTVVATFDSCDPSCLRYFRKEDALFVRSVFRTIANYETANLNKDLTSTDIPGVLASTDLNNDFSILQFTSGVILVLKSPAVFPPIKWHLCSNSMTVVLRSQCAQLFLIFHP
jgi:hypothetical protein